MIASKNKWAGLSRWALLLLIAYWTFQFILTHIPLPGGSPVHASDKTLHAVAFFILASLFWLALTLRKTAPVKKLLIIALVLSAYGAIDELTQPIVARNASFNDWLADIIGIAIALVFCEACVFITRLISILAKRRDL